MSDHVPAWKKIGLKVKETQETDPIALTTHLDSGTVTKKQAKQINKRKLKSAGGDKTEKKPPKRQKVPKSERAPPPEKDQLVYLRTYTTDKDNWKFSKQKQNWILKNIKDIEDKYEEYLVNYLVGVQGGSRDRILEDLNKVVDIWNKAAKDEPKKDEEKSDKEEEVKAEEERKPQKNTKNKDEGKKVEVESVDADYAIRAKKIIMAMSEIDVELIGINEEEAKKQTSGTSLSDESQSSVSESDKSSNLPDHSGFETSENTGDASQPKNNLVIEQVEVTDFVSEADYVSSEEEEREEV